MTAPALNPAPFVPPAAAGAASSASGAPSAAAGAFEALMTVLFPPTPAAAGAPDSLATADLVAEDATAQDAEPGATDPEDEIVGDDAAAALAASLQGSQPNAPQANLVAAKDAAATAPAWGRDKANGAPAQPALLHANARADLAGKTEPASDATGDGSETSTPSKSEPPLQPVQTLPSQASVQARAATQAAPGQQTAPAAPPPIVDADAPPPPPPAEPEIPAPGATSNGVAPSEAAVAAAASLAQRTEARAQADRATKAESPSNDARGATGDLKPREASAKPVLAKPTDPAARASAAVEAADPKAADIEGESDAPDTVQTSEGRSASQSSAPAAQTAQTVRGSPETVAALAAQIIKKLDGKSTRFDVELDPAGLGKVDVRVEIGAHGRLVASMVFENPQAAQDLKARAGELQRALEQAGFDLSGGLSFDTAGDRGRQGQAWQEEPQDGRAFQGRAFRQALDTAGDADAAATQGALRLRRGVSAGLDLRI